jgi:hypothetical protein
VAVSANMRQLVKRREGDAAEVLPTEVDFMQSWVLRYPQAWHTSYDGSRDESLKKPLTDVRGSVGLSAGSEPRP